MAFEFIDHTAPVDPAARQRIRRQAALGKNLGRKISRPSRKQALRLAPQAVAQSRPRHDSSRKEHDVESEVGDIARPEQPVGSTLTQLGFRRIGPDSLIMNAMNFVVQAPLAQTMGLGKAVHADKVPLFSILMFQDEAFFHGIIAFSLRALSLRPEADDKPSTLAIQHMSRSLQIVNTRFAAMNRVRDVNIAVVVIMAQYARMSGHLDECRMHLDGLQRMVQLRGGINAINPGLAEKIFRNDLGCAYQLAAPTRFTLAEMEDFASTTIRPGGILSKVQRQTTKEMAPSGLMHVLDPVYRGMFLDATRLTRVLDEAYHGKRKWITIRTLHEAQLYIGYQVLCAPPEIETSGDADANLLTRLGLVTFSLALFRTFDPKIVGSSPLSTAIDKAIQDLAHRGAWAEELVLWIVFLGHVNQVFGEDVRPSLMRRVKLSVELLKLTSWHEATAVLIKFPWSDALHGDTGKTVWDILALLPSTPTSIT